MSDQIYLDYNASTPVEAEVVDKMIPFFLNEYGNPSNQSHRYGWAADEAADMAREQLAKLIGASAKEIIFTSGGTESINIAIRGAVRAVAPRRRIVTTAVEHTATLAVMKLLAAEGFDVQYVGVDRDGRLNEEQ